VAAPPLGRYQVGGGGVAEGLSCARSRLALPMKRSAAGSSISSDWLSFLSVSTSPASVPAQPLITTSAHSTMSSGRPNSCPSRRQSSGASSSVINPSLGLLFRAVLTVGHRFEVRQLHSGLINPPTRRCGRRLCTRTRLGSWRAHHARSPTMRRVLHPPSLTIRAARVGRDVPRLDFAWVVPALLSRE
jgi:hypothetical protein